jgi:hypothetical protein
VWQLAAKVVARRLLLDVLSGVSLLERYLANVATSPLLALWFTLYRSPVWWGVLVVACVWHHCLSFLEAGPEHLRELWVRNLEIPVLVVYAVHVTTQLFWRVRMFGRSGSRLVILVALWFIFVIDLIVQAGTGYRTGSALLTPRYVLPVSSLLRPVFAAVAFVSLYQSSKSLWLTLYTSWRVLLLSVCLLLAVTVAAMSSLRGHGDSTSGGIGSSFDDFQKCVSVLRCAVRICAVLCCAVLCCAVLCCAVLCCAVLCCAVLCCAVLCCAVLLWFGLVWCVVRCIVLCVL